MANGKLLKCWGLLSLLCFLSVVLQCVAQKSYPDVRAILDQSYHTHVEKTFQPVVKKDPTRRSTVFNESLFIEEFHDRKAKTGFFKVLTGGIVSNMYYFQETDEFVTIAGSLCKIVPLSKSNFPTENGVVHAGVSAILYLLSADKMTYQAPAPEGDFIRGIKVSHFQGERASKQYDVYFRDPDWLGDDQQKREVPVRIVEKSDNLTVLYDFYTFEPYTPTPGRMNLKTGIGCKGKKNPPSKTVPKIPDQVSFQYEIYNSNRDSRMSTPEQDLELNKIWFDTINKVAKVELNQRTVQGVTEIHDFKSGIMYKFSKDKMCQMTKLQESIFARSMKQKGVVAMKTPADMLALKGDFYYAGQTVLRGVACDIWESVLENEVVDGVKYVRLVTTFYFTTLKWFTTVDGQEDTFVPIYRVMEGAVANEYDPQVMWMPSFHLAVSYFDFEGESHYDQTFLWNMDIRDCFFYKNYFELLFLSEKNVTRQVVLQNYNYIKQTLWEKLYSIAEISPLRIPQLEVSVLDDSSIHVVGLLLPQPGAIASFGSGSPSTGPGKLMKHTVKVPSQEECAQQCLDDKDCMVFVYCDHECFTAPSMQWKDWGEITYIEHCQQYTKSDVNISVTYKDNKEVLKNIKSEVDNQALVLQISDKKTSTKVTYKAAYVNVDASPFNEQSGDGLYELAYKEKVLSLKQETTMEATMLDMSIEITSVQQCYRNCISESGLECASFSFCPGTKKACRLSSMFVQDDVDAKISLETDTRCNVYTRSYSQFFDKFPGSVSRVGGYRSVSSFSPATCAKECKGDPLVRCRGFEYCPGSKQCILHEKHFLDIRPEDIVNGSDSCSHYALKFSADYWEGAKKELLDPNSRTIDLIGFEECAKACSLDDSGTCKSFNFCPGDDGPKRRCVLNTLTVLDKEAVFKDSSECLFYMQQDHVNDFIHQTKVNSRLQVLSGYTSSGLAGLLIGMLILGLLLGAAGFVGYNFYRAKKNPDASSTVRFVRHEDS